MSVPRLNITRKDAEAFFGPVLEKYRAQGFARAEMVSLESRPLGINSVLATLRYKSYGAWTSLLQTEGLP